MVPPPIPGIVRHWRSLAAVAYDAAFRGESGYSTRATCHDVVAVPTGSPLRFRRETHPLPGALLIQANSAAWCLDEGHPLRAALLRLIAAFGRKATTLQIPGLLDALAAAIVAYDEWEQGVSAGPPDDPDEARDRYCYEEECKGTTRAVIRAEVNSRVEWAGIGTDAGIKDRAVAYACCHDLPPPPPRQRGRKAKRK